MSGFLRLGDHCVKIGSGSTPCGGHKSYVANGIPLIRSQNVLMRTFTSEGLARITPETHGEMAGTEVQPGDVLLNITGASIGRVCVVPDDVCPGNVNQHVCIIRCGKKIVPQFLMLFLSSPAFQKLIEDTQAGGTRQALTKSDIESFKIPNIGITEQNAIAAALNQRLAAASQAEKAALRQLDELKLMPEKLLRSQYENILSPAGGGIAEVPLHEFCQLLPSKSICLSGDAEVRAITSACLTETGFDPAGIKASRMASSDATNCIVGAGEILVARSNTPELVGRVAMFTGEVTGAVASDLTIRVWPSEKIHGEFLSQYLSALYLGGYWRERAGGASGTMKKITRSQILNLLIPAPPLDEQRTITTEIKGRLAVVREAQEAARGQLADLKLLPQKLLAQVFES